ncbi:MAG: type II toxin-antitoxin system RelE/ParE family toxin [Saprospiraceae bacterium]
MINYEWRPKAFQELEETAQHLATEFSLQASENFLKRIADTIEKICKHPTIGMPSRKFKTIRSYKVDKYRRLYYRAIGKKSCFFGSLTIAKTQKN